MSEHGDEGAAAAMATDPAPSSSPPPPSPPPPPMVEWPEDGALTRDWVAGLTATLDWCSRHLPAGALPSVLPAPLVQRLVLAAAAILHREPNLVRVDPGPGQSVVVVGDVHGQLHDVIFLLRDAGFPSEGRLFVFNGDYVDRGGWGLETFLLLLAWKVLLPNCVFLLRGNHESKYCTSVYGFEQEVMTKYKDQGPQVYRKFLRCFEDLPLATIIAGCVYTAHGGIFRGTIVLPSKRAKKGKKGRKYKADFSVDPTSMKLGSLDELLKARRTILDPPWEGANLPPQPNPFASFAPPPPPPPQQQQEKPAAPAPAMEREEDAGWTFPDLRPAGVAGGGQDGDELLKALLAAQAPLPSPLPPPPQQQKQQQPVVTPADVAPQPRVAPASALARAQPSGRQVPGGVPRSKRRKNQVKKVVRHVPADGSSSDVWAWRKYGQKPIKGSPYPRGYYRCSSSKGCAARKQVERSRTDPNTFILTYTNEHNHAAPTHRNSLAGTTRHKFPASASPPPPSVVVGAGEAQQQQHQQPSPPSTSAGLSPTTPLRTPSMEEDEEEEDELLVEDMEMAGEDELLFLNGDGDGAAPLEPMSSLFDAVDEPFLGSPWAAASAAAGEPAAGATGAGS